MSTQLPTTDEIARVAYAIWEAEGFPDGRDHEHWVRAKQLIEEGGAEALLASNGDGAARPVQPGFEDAAPGMVPDMKENTGSELHEEPGGRFAKQLADLPEDSPQADGDGIEAPGRSRRSPSARR